MSSKAFILSEIRGIGQTGKPLPELPSFGIEEELESAFRKSIEANKGQVVNQEEFSEWLRANNFPKIVVASTSIPFSATISLPEDPHELDDLNLAILEGQLGVAENGAIWLDDRHLPHRALPFITEHLVIVLLKSRLFPTMHQAYEEIGNQHSGFGLFIAGPSKTADIEQSLVIGAHGAMSLRVILV